MTERTGRGMGKRVPRRSRSREPVRKSYSHEHGASHHLLAAALFAVATLVLTYPLAVHPETLSRLDNGDARLNAWAISWVSHQMVEDPLRLFDANTFYPLPRSLAYSEHLTLQGIAAIPLLALTDDLTLTNNLLLMGSIWLSALGMYWLARGLTGNYHAAVLAGLFFAFVPFRFNRLPHIQMQLYAFVPIVLACLHRFLTTKERKYLAGLSFAFVLQVLAGTYLGAIAAVALAIALVCLLPGAGLARREIVSLGIALAAAALALVPFTLPYLWVHRELGIEWDLAGLSSLSATPWSYLASSSHLYRDASAYFLSGYEVTDYLFPGLTLVGLGIAGALVLARDAVNRPIVLCYTAILIAGVLLSLGPRTPIYPLLYEHIVFFRGLRALTRFGLLPIFSLSVLSAFALAWLFQERGGVGRRNLAAWTIAIFFVFESTGLPYELVPHEDDPPEVYRWLGEAKPGPIVELPFKVIDTRYMFWARHHGFRKTLNGDSGFVPMSHQWVKNALQRFPSHDSVALLQQLDVRYVVLHLGAFRKSALLRLLQSLPEHRDALLPIRDFGKELVFEVVPRERVGSGLPEGLETIALGQATGAPEAMGPTTMYLELPDGTEAAAIRVHFGPTPRVPVARVEVFERGPDGDELRFTTPPDWPAVTALVEGLLRTPKDGNQTIAIENVSTDRIRLILHGLDGETPDVTEVEILGRPST